MKVLGRGARGLQKPAEPFYNPCQNGALWKARNWHPRIIYKQCEMQAFGSGTPGLQNPAKAFL